MRVRAKKKLHTSDGPMELDVCFESGVGEFVTLFGKSGAGKTTILRMMAGLSEPEEGYIEVSKEVWFDSRKKINWPVQKRSIGFVFQEHNLFPNMTVEENLHFALQDKKDAGMIEALLEAVHLTEFQRRRPAQLSSGQKQRVALIRALLRKPKVLLLDEPFVSQDLELRLKLQEEMLDIYKRHNASVIFVSHDFSEIFKLSDRILVLDKGRIQKSGRPDEIFAAQTISGKFKFPGVIVDMRQEDFLYIVTVQIGNNLTKVVAAENEVRGLSTGDHVLVAAKAFNPIILKAFPKENQKT
ncbi:MAG TPA: molybdenum ABC transporter ATP-binding protein [Candidatus Omnitrophica bacterium]|nr:molybdenum ABC transporter ATP-binding protein [Candidatus Omnitrophota bacterium]